MIGKSRGGGGGRRDHGPSQSARIYHKIGFSYSRRPESCHIVTLGLSTKGSSDFLQGSLGKGSVKQRRVQEPVDNGV